MVDSKLRDYQQEVRTEIELLVKKGCKRILIYSPTGSGKTVIFSDILRGAVEKGNRSMLVVHRDFLIKQTIKSLEMLGVSREDVGIIKAESIENRERLIQICSIHTLARRDLLEGIKIVIVDECHTTAFFKEYECIKKTNPNAIYLGFTASPWRLKSQKEYFGQHFDSIVLGPTIQELINKGILSSPRYFGWGGVDFSGIKQSKDGDYNAIKMGKAYIQAKQPEQILEKIEKLAGGRTGIIFNASLEQSLRQTEILNKAGIVTRHIGAKTPISERQKIFDELASGDIQCISSIGCLTEGFDVKSISFIVLARATKSFALYIQMCGRGLRESKETQKQDCLILDFGCNIYRHGLLTAKRKITLEPSPRFFTELDTKICPDCHRVLSGIVRVCPDCGHIFYEIKEEEENTRFEQEFGEIFDIETWRAVKYLRTQRKIGFSKNRPPRRLKYLFARKFPNIQYNEDWLFGAIFQGKDTLLNRQLFLVYLKNHIDPFAKPEHIDYWIKKEIEKEFGKFGCKYKTGKEKYQQASSGIISAKDWYSILEIEPSSDIIVAIQAYKSLVLKYEQELLLVEPEDRENVLEKIKMINWALDFKFDTNVHKENLLL